MVSSIFRQKFADFQFGVNNLHLYVQANRQGLKNGEHRPVLDNLIDNIETPLRSLRNRGLPQNELETYARMRKRWLDARKYLDHSSKVAHYKPLLAQDPNSPNFKLAEKVCREGFKALKKHHNSVKVSLPSKVSTREKLEVFCQSIDQINELSFDPRTLIDLRQPITELSNYLRSIAPIEAIAAQPLEKYKRDEEDLYDDLVAHNSTRSELERLSATFVQENQDLVHLLNEALLRAPQELVRDFSTEVFSRTRLLIIAILHAVKTNSKVFDRYLTEEGRQKVIDIKTKLANLENPVKSFLDDELDDDAQGLLFQIFSNIKFLSLGYTFDNPHGVEEDEKETKIFSAFIQVELREKYFPKQEIVAEIQAELDKVLKLRKKKDYKFEFSAIVELFCLKEFELGTKFLLQLCNKSKDSSCLVKIITSFFDSQNYGSIKPYLLQMESLPSNMDFFVELFKVALEIRDYDFAALMITKAFKSSVFYRGCMEALPNFVQTYSDSDIWFSIVKVLQNKNETPRAVDVMIAVLKASDQEFWNMILEKLENMTGGVYFTAVLQRLVGDNELDLLSNFIQNKYPQIFPVQT